MPNFRYRALTQSGEIVNGTIAAPDLAEVARRIEYLRLLPIETIEDRRSSSNAARYGWFGRPSSAEITTFTRDLALLLKAGARLDDALELLAADADVGRNSCGRRCKPSRTVSADVCRTGSRRRGFRHAGPGAGNARCRAGAIRADAAQANGCDAIPGLCHGRGQCRHAVLYPVRSAAI